MGWMTRVTLACGSCLACITASLAAAPPTPVSTAVAPAFSFDTILGKKLYSVDGSAVTLTALEGTLIRETNAAGGAMKKTSFHFLTDQLGTVTDLAEPNKPLGVFRIDKRDAIIQYADGGFEAMFVSPEGGLLVQSKTPQQPQTCMAWYPEGHTFSVDERKEAVAQYASRLGIPENSNKENVPHTAGLPCGIRTDWAATPASEKTPFALAGSGETVVAVSAGLPLLATTPDAPAFSSALAIAPSNRTLAATSRTAANAGTAGMGAPPMIMLPPTSNRATPEQFEQLRRAREGVTLAPEGASKCLSVESERGFRGFRNYCAYPVQFAYCVVGRRLGADSCQYGAVHGSSEPWGFSTIGDSPLNAGNIPIELRWIGCRGRAADVLPRLEQIDPPSGHCVAVAR
jgi:hypothetical protein